MLSNLFKSFRVIFFSCCLLLLVNNAWAVSFTIKQLPGSFYYASFPSIHNGQVAWSDSWNIQLYNGTQTNTLLGAYRGSSAPQIHNGQVAWRGQILKQYSSIREIFFYNGSQTVQITNDTLFKGGASIYNGQLAWSARDFWAGEDYEVYKYTGGSISQLTNNNYHDLVSKINNGQIVWDGFDGNDHEIFLYNGGTVQLTNNAYYDSAPDIHNGQVVWYGYDGNDYEIFFYDGTQTIQLTDNNYNDVYPRIHNGQIVWTTYMPYRPQLFLYDGNQTIQMTSNLNFKGVPRIHNGQVVWDEHDGTDWEIMYYDQTLPNPVPITNNITHDRVPQIHNGQVAWIGTNGVFMATVTPTAPGFTLETLDGSGFSTGTEVSNDPNVVALGGNVVEGAVTDGVTRLLLRVDVPAAGGVTFTLNGTGNPNEDGVFRSIDGLQTGSTITVNSVTTSQGEQAFAIYQAPGNFVRAGFEATDGVVSERALPIRVELTSGSEPPIDQQLRLMRTPLILVHGLWSNEDMWAPFSFALQNVLSDFIIIQADYRDTNDEEFIVNRDVVGYHIRVAKGIFKNTLRIAMTQADVMGHSMGGILSRIHYGGTEWIGGSPYLEDINFQQGDINKLITIDSVHYGSFMADLAENLSNNLPTAQKLLFWGTSDFFGMSVYKGAVKDLSTTSPEIAHLNTVINTINPASRPLVGDYVINVDLTQAPGIWGTYYQMLNDFGVDTSPDIIPGQSDLVVSMDSQAGGITIDPLKDIFNHHHNAILSEEVLARTIELLNAKLTDITFENGFPTGTYP